MNGRLRRSCTARTNDGYGLQVLLLTRRREMRANCCRRVKGLEDCMMSSTKFFGEKAGERMEYISVKTIVGILR